MFNIVLWTLDNDFDPFRFERLCTDLMFRKGYKDIIPFGKTRDRGRDAQMSLYRGNDSSNSSRVFFQYSLEKKWESKLKKEIQKIKSYDQKISHLVFVTTQSVSGEKRDKLESIFSSEYQCTLEILDREWLRFQLEEVHQDLAQKYLGIGESLLLKDAREAAKPSPPTEYWEEAWTLFIAGKYEQALPQLKGLLGTGFDADAWKCIAWCYYILLNYGEALFAIEESLKLESNSRESLTIKGCILAESGIAESSRHKLALSKKIFLNLVDEEKSWVIHYNLGRVFDGLQEYVDAKESYFKAIDIDDKIAEIWNNLGNCFHHLGEHENELVCLDKAISLNSDLSQAFVSKANTLGEIYGRYKEAIHTLDFVLERNPRIEREFLHFWHLRSRFLLKMGNIQLALESTKIGLTSFPDNQGLLDLKLFILSHLWPTENAYLEEAREFFEMMSYANLDDYRPLLQLAQIHLATSKSEDALECVKKAINILSPMQPIDLDQLSMLQLSVEDLIESIHNISIYNKFRSASPVSIPISYSFGNLDDVPKHIYKFAWICFLISFKELLYFFMNIKDELEVADEIKTESFLFEVFKKCHENIDCDIVKIANVIGLIYSNQTQDYKIQVMSSLALVLPEVALIEYASQIGYLVGIYNIRSKALERIELMAQRLLIERIKDLSDKVLRVVNDHFLLLNNSEGSN